MAESSPPLLLGAKQGQDVYLAGPLLPSFLADTTHRTEILQLCCSCATSLQVPIQSRLCISIDCYDQFYRCRCVHCSSRMVLVWFAVALLSFLLELPIIHIKFLPFVRTHLHDANWASAELKILLNCFELSAPLRRVWRLALLEWEVRLRFLRLAILGGICRYRMQG